MTLSDDPVFAALLDAENGGRIELRPLEEFTDQRGTDDRRARSEDTRAAVQVVAEVIDHALVLFA
jgi:hypothetical protein